MILSFQANRLLIIGGFNKNGDLATTELTNGTNRLHCNVPYYPIALYLHSSSVAQSGVVTCGGHDKTNSLRTCYKLAKAGNWVSFPALKSKRYYFGMKMMNGKLWAIGGVGGGKYSMESIDPENQKEWTKQSLPFGVYGHCLTEFSNYQLIVTGGLQDGVSLRKDKWRIFYVIN